MIEKSAEIIQFHYLTSPFTFRHRNRLKGFITRLFHKEGFKVGHINYIFCTDAYLLEVNRQYLNHDFFTDIITFPLSSKGEPVTADIYISIDRVKDNARNFNTVFSTELKRVIFHGALHLCGYKDKTKIQTQQMRLKEDHYLDRFDRST